LGSLWEPLGSLVRVSGKCLTHLEGSGSGWEASKELLGVLNPRLCSTLGEVSGMLLGSFWAALLGSF